MMFFNSFENRLAAASDGLVFAATAGDTPISSAPIPAASDGSNQQLLSQLTATVVNASIPTIPPASNAYGFRGVSHAVYSGNTPLLSDCATATTMAAYAVAAVAGVGGGSGASAFTPCTPMSTATPATLDLLSRFAAQRHCDVGGYAPLYGDFSMAKKSLKAVQAFHHAAEPLQGHAPTSACEGCHREIADRCFIQIGGRSWHEQCVRCAVCSQLLEDLPTCFTRDGLLYCRQDYLRKFPRLCERCSKPIGAGELVMHATPARIFHLTCFTCVLCGWSLSTGETYFLGEAGALICQRHCDGVLTRGAVIADNTSTLDNSGSITTLVKSENGFENDCKRLEELEKTSADLPLSHNDSMAYLKLESTNVTAATATTSTPTTSFAGDCTVDDELSSADGYSVSGTSGHSHKAKRMRTSFKHQQLRMMKNYFNVNHNPDAKDLKQLALKTGLSKRVLQVWFQNARAKYRRAQQNHRMDVLMPRCGSGSGGSDGSPTTAINYAMELQMLSHSVDMNGFRYGTASISGRTSVSPADSTTMLDACSFADDSSPVGGGNNSDTDSALRQPLPAPQHSLAVLAPPLRLIGASQQQSIADVNIMVL